MGKELVLPSGIRLDLLAVDRQANLVVIELKRDSSGRDVEWQAIKYA
ncbi:MAG: MmcB family DNA repair protein, partial [Chloroflexi bacterium]|nr:MmcB family DNA repair protein [Chloroflexota bacterium]